jgi:hypothetical protein
MRRKIKLGAVQKRHLKGVLRQVVFAPFLVLIFSPRNLILSVVQLAANEQGFMQVGN